MAVTAYPVILVDSATGTDSNASGAGPGTALTGTAGGTSVSGTQFDLDGSPDLTNVATDGSHVIFSNDASGRKFGAINGKGNSGTPTAFVTVEQAFTDAQSSLNWAIGGVRDTVFGSDSALLFNTSYVVGSWTVEMQSGHTENLGANTIVYGGSGPAGAFTLRGESGAATKPIITITGGTAPLQADGYTVFTNFNASSGAVYTHVATLPTYLENIEVRQGTTAAVGYRCGPGTITVNCVARECSTGFDLEEYTRTINCVALKCTGRGFWINEQGGVLISCISANNDIGFEIFDVAIQPSLFFCVADNNTNEGLRAEDDTMIYNGPCVFGCQFTNNAVNIAFTHSTHDDLGVVTMLQGAVMKNNTYNGSTANVQLNGNTDNDVFGTDHYQPYNEATYSTRETNMDWSVSTSAKQTALLDAPPGSSTQWYYDQGPQREEPAGGGGGGGPVFFGRTLK